MRIELETYHLCLLREIMARDSGRRHCLGVRARAGACSREVADCAQLDAVQWPEGAATLVNATWSRNVTGFCGLVLAYSPVLVLAFCSDKSRGGRDQALEEAAI